jgi:hypothetical protein
MTGIELSSSPQPVPLAAPRLVERTEFGGAPQQRDPRLDVMRGLGILFVLVAHSQIFSLWYLSRLIGFGTAVGAEAFVIVSGIAIGLAYRGRHRADTARQIIQRMFVRATKLYGITVGITLSILALAAAHVPGVADVMIRHNEISGTVPGQSIPLLSAASPLRTLARIATLSYAPWPTAFLVLFVVLTLITPAALILLMRGRPRTLLAASAAVAAISLIFLLRIHPGQVGASAARATWQLLYVLGLMAGWYRAEWEAYLRTRGRWLLGAAFLVTAGLVFFWMNSPIDGGPVWGRIPMALRLHFVPEQTFNTVNSAVFGRRAILYPGRLICSLAMTVTIYAMLTRWWGPINRAVGWLLIPLGRASLVVFVVHIYLLIGLANLSAVHPGHWPLNTAVQTGIILLMWVVARLWLGSAGREGHRVIA